MRAVILLSIFVLAGLSSAFAQNSTQAPPPSAAALSGSDPKGDPSGAVRALGSSDDEGKAKTKAVTVPRLGGEGRNETHGVPAGTIR